MTDLDRTDDLMFARPSDAGFFRPPILADANEWVRNHGINNDRRDNPVSKYDTLLHINHAFTGMII